MSDVYAIVKSGGKQYRVEQGQRLLVERLPAAEGSDVALEPILYRAEEAVFDSAGLEKVNVTARVVAHVRGEKLRVFKFKPKRGYKRRTGHRQELTQLEVTKIAAGGGGAAKAAAKAPAKPAAAKAAAAKPRGDEGASAKAAAPAKSATKAKAPARKAKVDEETPNGA